MTTGIIYDPIFLKHRIGEHVESHLRLITIMDFLKQQKLLPKESNNRSDQICS